MNLKLFFLLVSIVQGLTILSGQNKQILKMECDPNILKGGNHLIHSDKNFNIFASIKNGSIIDIYGFDLKSLKKIKMGIDLSIDQKYLKSKGKGSSGINATGKMCVECPIELCPQPCIDPSGKTVNCWCQTSPCKPVLCTNSISN